MLIGNKANFIAIYCPCPPGTCIIIKLLKGHTVLSDTVRVSSGTHKISII